MLVSRQNTDRQSFKRLERGIRSNLVVRQHIRQTYRPTTIIRQIADKNFCTDLLNIKQRALFAGTSLKNWYNVIIGQ